jgi:hypothetical protein
MKQDMLGNGSVYLSSLSGGGKVAILPPNLPVERLVISHGEILNIRNSRYDPKQYIYNRCVYVQKAKRRTEMSVNTHNRLKYFLTNKIFLLQVMCRYVRMIFIVKCVTIARFIHCLCSALMEKHDFYCSVIP